MSNTELIDAYFGNEMTPAEKQAFENRLQSDADLKEEFDFQKDIIDALRATRKAQLKARLDQVVVDSGSTNNNKWGNTALAIVVAGLVGLGIYALWPESTAEKGQVIQNQPTKINIQDEEKEEIPTLNPATQSAPQPQQEETKKEKFSEEKIAQQNPVSEESVMETEESIPTDKEVVIPRPGMAPTFDTPDESTDSLKAPGNHITAKAHEDNTTEVVINNNHRHYSFHYQFKEGKLYLFGDFNNGLYEIIDINNQADKMLFLYYQGNFYALDPEKSRETPLKAIENPSLIKTLEAVREE